MSSHRALAPLFSPTSRLVSLVGVAAVLGAHLWAAGQKPRVSFDGCAGVRRLAGQTSCIVRPTDEVVLWAEETACEDLVVVEGGATVERLPQMVAGGCQIRLPAGLGSTTGGIEVLSAKSGESLLALRIDRSQPTFLSKTARMVNRSTPDLRQAQDEYLYRRSQTSGVEDQIDIINSLAIAYQRTGDLDNARKFYTELVELSESAGYYSVSISANAVMARLLTEAGYYPQAKVSIDKAYATAQQVSGISMLAVDLQYAIMTEAAATAKNTLVVESLKKTVQKAEGLGNREILSLGVGRLIGALNDLRRFDEAMKILPLMNAELVGASDCDRARILGNQAVLGMNFAESGDVVATPVMVGQRPIRSVLDDAVVSRKNCFVASSLIRLCVSQARLALLEDRRSDVSAAISACRAIAGFTSMPYQMLSMLDFEAQLVLRNGNPQEALRLFTDLAKQATAIPSEREEFALRTAIGKLEALRQMNKSDSAAMGLLQLWLQDSNNQPPAMVGNISRRLRAVAN